MATRRSGSKVCMVTREEEGGGRREGMRWEVRGATREEEVLIKDLFLFSLSTRDDPLLA